MLREMPVARDSDHELVQRVAEGDGDGFRELFRRHSSAALGLLVKILKRRDEAEEVLQEVFLEVWKGAGRYDGSRASVRGWILLRARSRAIDRVRSRRARAEREQGVHEAQVRRSGEGVAPVGTSRLEREERSREIGSALDRLPEPQRQALELAYFEGLTQAQIAERVNAPLGTIKSRVLLGMKKLRQTLGGLS